MKKEERYQINSNIIRRKEKGTFMVLFPLSKRFLILNRAFSKNVKENGLIKRTKKYSHILQNLLENRIIQVIKDDIPKVARKGKKRVIAPLNVTFQITNRCNLNCLHCHRSKDSFEDLELTTFRKIIDELREMRVFNINISGGEPLLHPNIFEMMKYISRKGLNITISTNLLLRNQEVTQKIAKMGIKNIHVSLDSYNSDIHDKIRGVRGSYGRLITNLQILKKYGIAYTLVTTLIDQTPKDYKKTIDKAFQLGATAHKTNAFVTQGYGASYKKGIKDFAEYKKIRKDKKKEYDGRMKIMAETMFQIQLGKEYISPKGIPEILNCGCPAGILTCAINEKGDVLACPFFGDKPAGNIIKNTFSHIWENSPMLRDLRNRQNIEKCATCKFIDVCGGCRARSYGIFRRIWKEDPYCFMNCK